MTPLNAALALAAEGHRVFFCNINKRPCCSNGFHDAQNDLSALRELYQQHPGPLVAIATGETIDVLDIDKKHAEAVEWFQRQRDRLPKTRTHRTGSGGLHFIFRCHHGLRNWTAWPVRGVDCRAAGGYVIWWPAAGKPVLDDAPRAAWPDWLLEQRVKIGRAHV